MRRVGIVGAGGISRTHADRWGQMPGVELAGFYDIAEDAAARAVEQFGGKAFGSLHEMFDAVDYVDVCTPGTAHAASVIAALEAGLPTVCEKPLANSVADCERIVDAAERTGTPLFVAMVVRFFPQFAKAKEVLGQRRDRSAGRHPHGAQRQLPGRKRGVAQRAGDHQLLR